MRSNERIRGLRTERRSRQQTVPINKVVTCLEQRPVECSRCHGKKIYRFGRLSQTLYDLKVSGAAVRRWVVQYSFQRYICWNSKAAFQLHSRQLKYGITFRAFAVYHLIDLLLPQRALARACSNSSGCGTAYTTTRSLAFSCCSANARTASGVALSYRAMSVARKSGFAT